MPKNARKSQQPKPKPKQSKRKNTPRITSFGDSLAADFALILKDPFHPSAYGARVPDPFSFPTSVYHVHGTTVIGNSTGVGTAVFLPNPNLSMIDCSLLSASTAAVNTTGMARYTNTTSCYGATTPASLAGLLSTYRVVSWGFKISNNQPELNAAGRIIIAPFTIGDTVPGHDVLSTVSASAGVLALNLMGSNTTLINNSSAILNLPSAMEFAVQDLLHGDIEVGCSVTNPVFFNFKTSLASDSYNATFAIGDEIAYVAATGLASAASGYKDTTRMHGGVGWYFYFEGVPPIATAAFTVEYVYHLEGTPEIGSTDSKITPVPSVPPCLHIGSTATVERAMSAVTASDSISWIQCGAQFLNNASKAATGQGILQHAQRAAGMHPVSNAIMKLGKMFLK